MNSQTEKYKHLTISRLERSGSKERESGTLISIRFSCKFQKEGKRLNQALSSLEACVSSSVKVHMELKKKIYSTSFIL